MTQENLFGIESEQEFKPDDTEIVQVLLYYSKPEARDFKALCKTGIKREFPEIYLQKGNVSDFLLKMLKKYYSDANTESKTAL